MSQECGQDQREGVRNERGGISNSVFESLVAAQLRGDHFKGGSLSCFATLPPTSRRWYQPGHSEVTHGGGGARGLGWNPCPLRPGDGPRSAPRRRNRARKGWHQSTIALPNRQPSCGRVGGSGSHFRGAAWQVDGTNPHPRHYMYQTNRSSKRTAAFRPHLHSESWPFCRVCSERGCFI